MHYARQGQGGGADRVVKTGVSCQAPSSTTDRLLLSVVPLLAPILHSYACRAAASPLME